MSQYEVVFTDKEEVYLFSKVNDDMKIHFVNLDRADRNLHFDADLRYYEDTANIQTSYPIKDKEIRNVIESYSEPR